MQLLGVDREDDLKEEEEVIVQAKEVAGRLESLNREIKNAWLEVKPIRDHESIAKDYAERFDINLTDAKKQLFTYPEKYEIQGNDIPKVIKQMRNHRRTLKGEKKIEFTKAIDNLIDGYADHLDKCVDSIYWIRKYKVPLKQMNNSEYHLRKLNSIESEMEKRNIIDTLCKYWEADLDRRNIKFQRNLYSTST